MQVELFGSHRKVSALQLLQDILHISYVFKTICFLCVLIPNTPIFYFPNKSSSEVFNKGGTLEAERNFRYERNFE